MPSPAGPEICQNSGVASEFAHHERELQALIGGLAQDEPRLGMITAEINEFGAERLQLAHQRAIILLAGIDAVEEDFLGAARIEPGLDRGREPLTISRFVMQDDDLLALVFLRDPRPDEFALRVVTPVKTHDRRPFVLGRLIGEKRVARGGRHHENVVLGIDA